MSTGDRILLTGVRATGRHGVLAEERAAGQDFVVDLELTLDLSVAAVTDRVVATVHYGELAEAVVAAIEGEPVDLIETLAQRIADVALAHELVDGVAVTVHKPSAPIPVPFTDVAVRIERALLRAISSDDRIDDGFSGSRPMKSAARAAVTFSYFLMKPGSHPAAIKAERHSSLCEESPAMRCAASIRRATLSIRST